MIKDAEPTLASAFVLAFAEIESATKSAKNPHFKTMYADLTSVIGAIKPALVKHGLCFTQCPQPSENGVTIRTWLHHASGESMELGVLFVPVNKNDAQGYGSALSYARRYALITAFGVPVEDDDGNAAVAAKPDPKPAEPEPGEPLNDKTRDWLAAQLDAAHIPPGECCRVFEVSSLKQLTYGQIPDLRAWIAEKKDKAA